jgi:hypothetical protein
VGQLVRNKAGRIEFVFDRALVEALELGLGPVSSGSAGLVGLKQLSSGCTWLCYMTAGDRYCCIVSS